MLIGLHFLREKYTKLTKFKKVLLLVIIYALILTLFPNDDFTGLIDLEREINLKLSHDEICNNTLAGFVIGSTEEIVLKDKNNEVYLKTGDIRDKLKIKKIELEMTGAKASQSNLALLKIFTQRTRKGGGPDGFEAISVNLNAQLDKNLKIESCSFLKENETVGEGNIEIKCATKVSHKAISMKNTCCTLEKNKIVGCIEVPSDNLRFNPANNFIAAPYRVLWNSPQVQKLLKDGKRPDADSMDCTSDVCCALYKDIGIDCQIIP